jgi:hypothetical protein
MTCAGLSSLFSSHCYLSPDPWAVFLRSRLIESSPICSGNRFVLDPAIVKEETDSESDLAVVCPLARSEPSAADEALLLELLESLKVLEAAEDDAFGFTVASKALPGARDLPWIELVHPDTPAAASGLRSGQPVLAVNESYLAGLSAKDVRGLVCRSGHRLRLQVKGAEGRAGAAATEVLLWRGAHGRLRDAARRWCRRAGQAQAEQGGRALGAASVAREVRRGLEGFLCLSDQLDLPELCDALWARSSTCRGAPSARARPPPFPRARAAWPPPGARA